MGERRGLRLVKVPTVEDIWSGFFLCHPSLAGLANKGQVVKAATLLTLRDEGSSGRETESDGRPMVVTKPCFPRHPADIALQPGDVVRVLHDDDPQYFHGYKAADPARRLGIFPKHAVAPLRADELPLQVANNITLASRRRNLDEHSPKPVRLYRNQLVFARQQAQQRPGWAIVRTEQGAEAPCPLAQLRLPKSAARSLPSSRLLREMSAPQLAPQ